MFKKLFISIFLLAIASIAFNDVLAQSYPNEVWQSGGTYYWRINGSTEGSSSSLSTAINSCMGNNREVHVTTGGTLNGTLSVPAANVRLYGHGNTFTCNFTGSGILNNGNDGFEIHDLTLRNVVGGYGIRSSAASDLSFTDLNLIDIDWIGIRIDSRTSNPWNYTEYNLYMRDIHVENIGSHGIETYSIDGVDFDGTMTARSTGGCGVLLNNSSNGTIETVDAYDCDWGGGYAGLRYANGCSNITTNKLIADHCGRGFFIVQSGPTSNSHLLEAEIYDCSGLGIWIENGTNCSVQSGCSESPVSVSGSGSYANVSSSCSGSGGTYYQFQNRASGLFLDGMGRSTNGDACGQWGNTTHPNSQWELVSQGGDYYQLKNRGTGLFLDGMGRTTNGDDCGQYANTTHNNSHWEIVQYSGSYYRLQNRGTGLYLDGMGRTTNGDNVGQWSGSSSHNQQWNMINAGSGSRVSVENDVHEVLNTEAQKAILLYPNPMQDVLNIKLEDNDNLAKVKIFDVSGKIVISKRSLTQSHNQIDVQDLKHGIYFVEIETISGIKRFKLIKE